jgi:hypothetical protein
LPPNPPHIGRDASKNGCCLALHGAEVARGGPFKTLPKECLSLEARSSWP